jgi:hypothetical protein
MRKLLVTVLLLLAAPAYAGRLFIGLDKSAAEGSACHTIEIQGPAEAARAYEARQRDRFEPIDKATLARLQTTVLVTVKVDDGDVACVQSSGKAEKIILTERGSRTPLLTILLTPEKKAYQNLAGATFTALNGIGRVAAENFVPLRDRTLDIHLVYADHTYKDLLREHYAAEVLRASR